MDIPLLILTFSLIAAAAAATVSPDRDVQDFVNAHNRARLEVGVPLVEWNETVAAYARRWAHKRRDDCEEKPSMGPYGENLLVKDWGRLAAVDAVGQWADENSYYDYASNTCVEDECVHYTQMVWRDSTQLGCVRRQCRNGYFFVICSYYPPGNRFGQRPFYRNN